MRWCGRGLSWGWVWVVPALVLGACSSSDDDADRLGAQPGVAGEASTSEAGQASPADGGHHRPGRESDDVLPAYTASVSMIGPELRDRMRLSHRAGCPARLSDLRLVRLSYVGFDGAAHRGELVVHEDHARAVVRVFATAYDARWSIRRMRLVDVYRGDDDRSMAANNTSAYNCRRVAGTDHWSAHAYGAAIDINPVQNPYVIRRSVAPEAGQRYAGIDRSRNARVPPGVIREGDLMVRAFNRIGWRWGGDWSGSPDYQHFYAPDRP
jgi:D-alanyl-D-alanine carboxypeptidase